MSEAELHILKARLRGGLLNKARRGDLAFAPPVGLVIGPTAPRARSRCPGAGTLRLVFATFARTGSALQTLRRLLAEGVLRLRGTAPAPPRRAGMGQAAALPSAADPPQPALWQRLRLAHPRRAPSRRHRLPPRRAPRPVVDRRPGPASGLHHLGAVRGQSAAWPRTRRALASNGASARFAKAGPAAGTGAVRDLQGADERAPYKQERRSLVPLYVCQEAVVRQGGRICQTVPARWSTRRSARCCWS